MNTIFIGIAGGTGSGKTTDVYKRQHAVAVRGERLRKAPRHIGKAARFAKRHRLARHIPVSYTHLGNMLVL